MVCLLNSTSRQTSSAIWSLAGGLPSRLLPNTTMSVLRLSGKGVPAPVALSTLSAFLGSFLDRMTGAYMFTVCKWQKVSKRWPSYVPEIERCGSTKWQAFAIADIRIPECLSKRPLLASTCFT
jgi:hypothetical protein